MAAAGHRYRTLERPLEASRREDGRAAWWDANRLHLASHDDAAGVDEFSKALSVVIVDGPGHKALPDCFRQVVQPREGAGVDDGVGHLLIEHNSTLCRAARHREENPCGHSPPLRVWA
jgi:hypothetical protein